MKLITDLANPTPENKDTIYNAIDSMNTMALKERFDDGLIPKWAHEGIRYSELMLGPIMTMMRRGVLVDLTERDKLVAVRRERLAKVQATLDEICIALWGTNINHNSTPQLKFLFYTLLGIPEQTTSKKGKNSVSASREVLERIINQYPRGAVFASFILRIRELETQIEFLTKGLSSANRFHASFNIAGTENFRLSSSEHPLRIGSNLQNLNQDTRRMLVPDPGYIFFYSDQQGAEARYVANKSGDPNYIAACEGGDSHTTVASMVFGFPPERELAERKYYRDYTYRDLTKKGAHGCLTADHEVLTPDGWVSIASMPDWIASWDPEWDGAVKFEAPSNWLEKLATELVGIEGSSISMLSTPEHKMIVNQDGKLVERTAATLRKTDKIPYAGHYIYGQTYEPLAQLVAAFQGDGNIAKQSIRFKFRRPRKIIRMRELLQHYPGQWSEATYGKDTCFHLNVSLSKRIKKWGKLAGPQLLDMDYASLRAFADEAIHWDGTIGKTNRQAVCSMSLDHVRWMQTIFQLCGWGSKVIDNTGVPSDNFSARRAHWVSRNKRQFASLSCCTIERHTLPTPVQVYCPTVSTGYFLVRRKGHIYVSGNSNYFGKPFTLAKQMKVETSVAEEFQARYFQKFPGIPDWQVDCGRRLQHDGYIVGPFGLRRTFWGRRWDDATLREAIAFEPQHVVGVLMNMGIYKLWEKYEGKPGAPLQILLNLHDAVLGQIRIDMMEELIPEILNTLTIPFPVTDIKGVTRNFVIPFDIELGYNFAKHDAVKNPTGLKKRKGQK